MVEKHCILNKVLWMCLEKLESVVKPTEADPTYKVSLSVILG